MRRLVRPEGLEVGLQAQRSCAVSGDPSSIDLDGLEVCHQAAVGLVAAAGKPDDVAKFVSEDADLFVVDPDATRVLDEGQLDVQSSLSDEATEHAQAI